MNDLILRQDADGIATLTLNRGSKLNALNSDMFIALDAELQAIEAAIDTIGVVVIRGAGKGFSAGLDLADATSGGAKVTPIFQSRTIARVARLPQPVIAAVHGLCYTGALELALAADIILATETTSFADTHGKWGLTPAWGMSQRLPRRVGRGQASRMMFSGMTIAGPEALAIGLVDLCVPEARFDEELAALAGAIAANSWFSNRENKRLMQDTEGLPLSAGLAHEFFRRPGRAPDFEERVQRFTKR
jgi:enoyl-CoA hydratase/carnithine racemase